MTAVLLTAIALLCVGLLMFWVEPLAVLSVLERLTPNVTYRVRTEHPQVALSFDDGPHPTFTPQVLEILQRHDAKANLENHRRFCPACAGNRGWMLFVCGVLRLHQVDEWPRFCANDCFRDPLSDATYFRLLCRLRSNRVERFHHVFDNWGLERGALLNNWSVGRRPAKNEIKLTPQPHRDHYLKLAIGPKSGNRF
jgi:hypothetical protein